MLVKLVINTWYYQFILTIYIYPHIFGFNDILALVLNIRKLIRLRMLVKLVILLHDITDLS